jgi:hypothetical protein
MGMKIISQRERVEVVSYYLHFASRSVPGAGWGPDCDERGNVLGDEHATKEQREAAVAEARLDPDLMPPEIRRRGHSYVQCAIGRCTCGAEVQLEDPLFNECDRCHRFWNICGQEKIDPNGALNRELDAESGEFYGIDY